MSSFTSPVPVLSRPQPYAHPPLRRAILGLITREGTVTRGRLAEALGVSRMTADRISAQLLAEGLLTELKGPDPIHGRFSRLLTLSPDPRLLLMDVDPHEPLMHAYGYESQHIRKLTLDHHLTKDISENELILRRGAEILWSLPPHAAWLHLLRRHDRPSSVTLPQVVSEPEALAHVLFYHPKLAGKRSVLYLRWGAELHGALYVREQTDDPWFVPNGGCFVRPLSHLSHDREQAMLQSIAPLISSYQALITPDVILLERDHAVHRESASYEITRHPLPSSGVAIRSWTAQDEGDARGALSAEVLIASDPIPLWVSGAIYKQREHRWLGDTAANERI